ncbi:MAG: prolyl-tRNA synthetase [Candidatus Moraniibacteriota bacterium]|nr:MAG: prolyl-tRNA synthetase [Candidatus Moranbacteria bacterium]
MYMKQSQLFTKTQKFAPKDEVSKNAQLLMRAGFVYKEMAGVYSFLPLGWRVMHKVMQVIREEMNAIGGQEMFLSSLQVRENWEKTERWRDDIVDVWFKTQLKNGTDVGLAFTHEEPITRIMKSYITSYKDLPCSIYQFQTKFRNEVRAKSGIMRSREFIMKDLYSFAASQEEHDVFYEGAKNAYINIFRRLGIGDHTYVTFASGGTFSKYSHEFQTECDAGEDIVYIDDDKHIAVNEEVYTDEVLKDLGLDKNTLRKTHAAEVGNIFTLGTKFSDAFGLLYRDSDEKNNPVFMGSYGIGPARCMGVLVELLGTADKMVWPKQISPYDVHVISIDQNAIADDVYDKLQKAGVSVLYDDRACRAGEKLADADLIGCHARIVIGKKSVDTQCVEVTCGTAETQTVDLNAIVDHMVAYKKQ